MTRPGSEVLMLAELNALGPEEAVEFFLNCCGSIRWATSMAECRPFWNKQIVLNAAEAIWQYLTPEDWREALGRRHPDPAYDAIPELRSDMKVYEKKFGYVFIVDPDSSDVKDPVAAVRRRLENPVRYEITIAAAGEVSLMRRGLRRRLRD